MGSCPAVRRQLDLHPSRWRRRFNYTWTTRATVQVSLKGEKTVSRFNRRHGIISFFFSFFFLFAVFSFRDLNANNLTKITKADFAGLRNLRVL